MKYLFGLALPLFLIGCSTNETISPLTITTPIQISITTPTPANKPSVATTTPNQPLVTLTTRPTRTLQYESTKSNKEEKGVNVSSIAIGDIRRSETKSTFPIYVAVVTVKNIDIVSGRFTVYFNVVDAFIPDLKVQTSDIEPGETKVFECPSVSDSEWSFRVDSPMIYR